MGGVSSGGGTSCGRGFHYHRLPEARPKKGGGSPPSSRVLVFARRVVVKAVGFYVGRRRWAARNIRRVRWMVLWTKVRRAVVGMSAARAGTRRHVVARYDSVSYAQNFDDGRWKEEEEDYWRSGSFAYRFGQSGFFGKLMESS